MAVAGAAHRVLGKTHLGGKGAGDTVVRRPGAGGGDLHQGALQCLHLVQVGLQLHHRARVVKDAHQVPCPPDLPGAGPQGVNDLVGDLQLLEGVGGKIQFKQLAPPPDGEGAAERLEVERLRLRLHKPADGIGGRQGGVSAQGYLTAGGEPPQMPVRPLPDGEGRLRQAVFPGNGQHLLAAGPGLRQTHRGRVSLKDPVGKGVHHILFHRCTDLLAEKSAPEPVPDAGSRLRGERISSTVPP